MKILFLIPYPLKQAPSQRFRFEQYFKTLLATGHTFKVQSFLDSHNWQQFFKSGNAFASFRALISGFAKRFSVLFEVRKFDFVFIHREATPLGPPVVEWIISKILRKKIIYDFDDAIWATDEVDESPLKRWLKWRTKVRNICSWSYKVSCGNQYLLDFAAQYNERAVLIPTSIDTEFHKPETALPVKRAEVVIGWTGSSSTLKYLVQIDELLGKVQMRNPSVRIRVIADRAPEFTSLLSFDFVKWNAQTEIEDLSKIHVGLMPLPDDEWSKGKCGFKILQYMALGIPAVASPVGVNTAIVQSGVSGFLCKTQEEWFTAIQTLIDSPEQRKNFGERGQKFIRAHYSVEAIAPSFLSLFV